MINSRATGSTGSLLSDRAKVANLWVTLLKRDDEEGLFPRAQPGGQGHEQGSATPGQWGARGVPLEYRELLAQKSVAPHMVQLAERPLEARMRNQGVGLRLGPPVEGLGENLTVGTKNQSHQRKE